MSNKDWCTFFPEYWYKLSWSFKIVKVYIGDCCQGHDTTCSTRKFFLCVKSKVGEFFATFIAFGGSVGCWWKHSDYMVKKNDDSVLKDED
jgi:hypothetical protein